MPDAPLERDWANEPGCARRREVGKDGANPCLAPTFGTYLGWPVQNDHHVIARTRCRARQVERDPRQEMRTRRGSYGRSGRTNRVGVVRVSGGVCHCRLSASRSPHTEQRVSYNPPDAEPPPPPPADDCL